MPNLIAIQKQSYDEFLQADVQTEERKDKGLQGAQEFSAFLKSLKIDHEFDLHEGGHNWGTEKNALDTYAFHNKHFKLSEQELQMLK